MYLDTVDRFAGLAAQKAEAVRRSPLGFFVAAMMAGAYVGLGIILIFTLGADVDPGIRRLVMGASFGIALTLVVFAGAELFTGLTMVMTYGLLRGRTGLGDLGRIWAVSWLGNLAGAALLAGIFTAGGGGNLLAGKSTFLYDVAAAKMGADAGVLTARAILCNWLVCLAIWMAARMTGETAKCIAIFWCLFAFVASGYEHSVANMTLLLLALLGDAPPTLTVSGLFHNLLWVSLGNVISGAGLMGVAYWFVSREAPPRTAAALAVRGTGP